MNMQKDYLVTCIEESLRYKHELTTAKDRLMRSNQTKKVQHQIKLIEELISDVDKDLCEYRRELHGK